MKRSLLGKTGIEVSELAFGTLILGRLQADLSPPEAAPAISKAVDLGINFFDTAQSYGTQDHLRVGLGRSKDEVVISTKTHARTRKDAQKAFEDSLRELDRDYIDIYQFHLLNDQKDFEHRRDVLELFLELKGKGLIRAIGASVHKVEAAKVVAGLPEIDVLFPVLNVEGLGIIDGTAQEMIDVCRIARDRGQGLLAMKPLAGGHLRDNPARAINFFRETGVMNSICLGMKSPAEVEMNVCLVEGREVPGDVLSRVEKVKRRLRIYDRCVGCGACVEACDQGGLSIDYSRVDDSRGKKGQSVVDPGKCILCGYCANVCPEFTIRVI